MSIENDRVENAVIDLIQDIGLVKDLVEHFIALGRDVSEIFQPLLEAEGRVLEAELLLLDMMSKADEKMFEDRITEMVENKNQRIRTLKEEIQKEPKTFGHLRLVVDSDEEDTPCDCGECRECDDRAYEHHIEQQTDDQINHMHGIDN